MAKEDLDTKELSQIEQAQGEIPEQVNEEVPVEDLNQRLKPAIDMIKEFLKQAQDKQQARAEAEAQEEAAVLESQNAEVVQEQPYKVYLSVDGDGIGNQVFQAKKRNDEEAMKDVDRRIKLGMSWLKEWSRKYGGEDLNIGGDDGLLKMKSTSLEYIEELRSRYYNLVDATLTVGVGKTIAESSDALQLGKLQGKNRTVIFDEETTTKELEARMEQEDIDCDKKLKICIQSGGDSSAGGLEDGETEAPPQEEIPKYNLPDDVREGVEAEEEKEKSLVDKEKKNQEEPEPEPELELEPEKEEKPKEAEEAEDEAGEEPAEVEPEEAEEPEGKRKSPVDLRLLKRLGDSKEEPKEERLGNVRHDPEIEDMDFSDRNNPEFAKGLWYAMKYGNR